MRTLYGIAKFGNESIHAALSGIVVEAAISDRLWRRARASLGIHIQAGAKSWPKW